jgi:hypothetical protein
VATSGQPKTTCSNNLFVEVDVVGFETGAGIRSLTWLLLVVDVVVDELMMLNAEYAEHAEYAELLTT